jgi:hypothetical protein
MGQLIRVEMKDGEICYLAKKALDFFLTQNKIAKFERSDGWAIVGEAPLRDMTRSLSYEGA